MTTGKSTVVQAEPACEFKYGKCRRKFKRACCCVTLLLLINAFLLLHTAHSIGAIMWFTMHGSYTYKDTTYLFMPGGAKAMCNDFCVDLCIYRKVGCDMNHCLNVCNEQLVEDGNEDDFQELPEVPQFVEYIVEDMPMEDADVMIEEMAPIYEDGITGDEVLDKLHEGILVMVDKINELKATYQMQCSGNPDKFGCPATLKNIEG
eukprot:304378_1